LNEAAAGEKPMANNREKRPVFAAIRAKNCRHVLMALNIDVKLRAS
jgi:hypothetical protein